MMRKSFKDWSIDFNRPVSGYQVTNLFLDNEIQLSVGADQYGRKIFIIHLSGSVSPPQFANSKFTLTDSTHEGKKALIGTLLVKGLDDIFERLVIDLFYVIDDSIEVSGEVLERRLLRQLKRWLEFFRPHKKTILSEEIQRGLIAELLFLLELTDELSSIEQALNCWRGPEGGPQDFVLDNSTFEVKAKLITSNSKVSITSAEQLSGPKEENFLLVNFLDKKSTQTSDGDEFTLKSLVDKIFDIASNAIDCFDIFLSKLTEVGYLTADEEEYDKNYYISVKREIYSIEEMFPKIVTSDLMLGVSDVEYKIDLSVAQEYLVVDLFKAN